MNLQYVIQIDIFERGSSSIAGEIGCLSINPSKAHSSLRRKQSCRLSSDVIVPNEAHRLSLDVVNPDVILC